MLWTPQQTSCGIATNLGPTLVSGKFSIINSKKKTLKYKIE